MWTNCDLTVIFPIYAQFGAMRKRDSGGIVFKTYIFNIVASYVTKAENRTKKSPTQLSHYCFE